MSDDDAVRAAGGVVWRRSGAGVEVLLVHRPRYDDWSWPKGKAEPGEDDETCAVREVEEETGLRCLLGRALGEARYRDRNGRPKVVRYFEMTPVEGRFATHDEVSREVDEVRWVPIEQAPELLTYEHDAALVARFLLPGPPRRD